MSIVNFDYESRRDKADVTSRSVSLIRVLGVFFIILGLSGIVEHWLSGSSFKIVLYFLQVFLGLIQLLYPKFSAQRWSFFNKRIKIDGESISWRLSKSQANEKVMINELEKITITPSEVQFSTKDSMHVLSKYQIESKVKFEEFNNVIEKLRLELKDR